MRIPLAFFAPDPTTCGIQLQRQNSVGSSRTRTAVAIIRLLREMGSAPIFCTDNLRLRGLKFCEKALAKVACRTLGYNVFPRRESIPSVSFDDFFRSPERAGELR
jgi:hypothetical protein